VTPPTSDRGVAALAAARAGADVAFDWFRSDPAVETKSGPTDFVSEADRASQRAVLSVLEERAPEEAVVAEEDGLDGAVPPDGPAWVVDPIDGTTNYVRGVPVWTVSVAAVVDGDPVASATVCPALGDEVVSDGDTLARNGEPASVSDRTDPATFDAAPLLRWADDAGRAAYGAVAGAVLEHFDDLRRYGSAQFTLAAVATGGLDAAVTPVTGAPWDTLAGVHQIRAGGGTVTDVHGDRWRHDADGLVASNGRAHDSALAAVREE